MRTTAILLVVLSAAIHAARDFLTKKAVFAVLMGERLLRGQHKTIRFITASIIVAGAVMIWLTQ